MQRSISDRVPYAAAAVGHSSERPVEATGAEHEADVADVTPELPPRAAVTGRAQGEPAGRAGSWTEC